MKNRQKGVKPALERFFDLRGNGTTVGTEFLAGITTFLTMAYIVFLNPAVLSVDFTGQPTGLDPQAVMLATCLASALATILMGMYANYPIAQAPGIGSNYFFVAVVMGLSAKGFTNAWQTGLAIVFLSGLIFLLLSIFHVRQAIIDALSPTMRCGVAVGIGLFIAFIGLHNGEILVAKPDTMVGLNVDLATPGPAVFFFGLLVICALQVRRIPGSLMIGILAGAGLAIGLSQAQLPEHILGLPQVESSAIFKMDFRSALQLVCIPFIVVFVFQDVFNTVGTLVGVAERAGLMKDGHLPRVNRALVSDAVGTMVGAALGTSTVTTYVESAAGVEQGGRTGLTAVVAGLMFLVALVFAPVIGIMASYPPITAPALVVVGVFMAHNVTKMDWDDLTESLPAFLIMVGIPLTYSIADGLGIGLVAYPAIKILAGRGREVPVLMYALSAMMLGYFVFLRPSIG